MRYSEFKRKDEDRTDEILPVIAGAGMAAARVAGMAAKGAMGAAKVGAKAAAPIVKGIGKAAGRAAVAGTKAVARGGMAAGKAVGTSVAQKVASKAADTLSNTLIKPGSSIPMPTQGSGGPKEFKVDSVTGDEVTIINPDARKAPEEPEKLTYKKQDIDTVIQGLSQGGPGTQNS